MLQSTLTTLQLGKVLHVRPGTVREAFCRQGHYLGMRPLKIPNGRLLWRAADVERILRGEKVTTEPAGEDAA